MTAVGAASPRGDSRRQRLRSWTAGFRKRDTWVADAFLLPWMIGFTVFIAGPMVASLIMSFTEYSVLSSAEYVGFANYQRLLEDPKVTKSLLNTFIFAVMQVPLGMIVSLALAMVLLRVGKAAGFFRTVFYLPVMTPKVAVGILFLLIFNGQVGVINKFLGLFGVDGPSWTTDGPWVKSGLVLMSLWSLGGTVVIYFAALRNVPQDLYESAAIDGASPWRQFRHVTLPMISGALFFTLIVHTIGALQTFDEAYTAFFGTSAQESYSNDAALFYAIYLFQQAFQFFKMGYASALAWLLFLIIMIITAIQVKVSHRFVYYEGE